jgi:hypothetical protein
MPFARLDRFRVRGLTVSLRLDGLVELARCASVASRTTMLPAASAAPSSDEQRGGRLAVLDPARARVAGELWTPPWKTPSSVAHCV